MRIKVVLALGALAATTSLAAWNIVTPRERAGGDDDGGANRRAEPRRNTLARRRRGHGNLQARLLVLAARLYASRWLDRVYGGAVDGRLLVTFPTKGDWTRRAVWSDPELDRILDGLYLPRKLSDRRDHVAVIFERAVGPVAQLDAWRCAAEKCAEIRRLSMSGARSTSGSACPRKSAWLRSFLSQA